MVIMVGIIKDSDCLCLVKEFGMDWIVDILKEDLVEVVFGMIDGYGVECVFDCFGVVFVVN